MNKVKNQFYKDIYNLFPIHTKKEKNYLNNLKRLIELSECVSYNELVFEFGSPIDIMKAYYDTIDSQYLLKKMNLKRTLVSICIVIITLALVISLWKIYIYNLAYEDFHNSIPDEITEVIEEDIK